MLGNIAPEGTGIIGYNDNDAYDDLGFPLAHAGSVAAINDGVPTSRVDTYSGRSVGSSSYVGILWPSLRSEKVKTLNLTLATFFDGGWFGVNGTGPGSGGVLTAAHLAEPSVQVTVDGGTTWTTVPHTSNYLGAMTGHTIGGAVVNPTSKSSTFTLTIPRTGITGIRLIGENGGTADGNGFLGAFEFTVAAATPGGDSDGDGQSNAAEAEAGTNPDDPKDFLRLTSMSQAAAGGGPVTLVWTSVPGKFYSIQQSTTLAADSWTWVLPSSVGAAAAPATTTSVTFDAPVPTGGGRYYRIQVSLPP
jgi:hypothetical protein